MNIIFDLGSVVFDWNPKRLIAAVFQDTNKRKLIEKELFLHPDWIALDRGTLDTQEAINRAVIRTGLPEPDISRLLHSVPHALVPIPGTVELIRRIKHETDHKLYVLSNMHFPSILHIEQKYTFWDLFDGRVISCRINMVKPELEIYHYLLNKFSLKPSETVFIDDKMLNVEAALQLGIKTILFENPGQCERDLERIGCFE